MERQDEAYNLMPKERWGTHLYEGDRWEIIAATDRDRYNVKHEVLRFSEEEWPKSHVFENPNDAPVVIKITRNK